MTKLTKKQKTLQEKIDSNKVYSIEEAMEIIQSVKSNKFDESIDISVKLGVDPNKSDQNVRGAVTLPNSLGKEVIVAVFADGDKASEAEAAGADFVGMEDLAEKFQKENLVVDVVISTNAAMKVVGKLGQVLGPKGLMPNPKTGTVTNDIKSTIDNINKGLVAYKSDKAGTIHAALGKISFEENQISENINSFIEEIKKIKPSGLKGNFINSVFISSTMGVGLKVEI